MNRLATETSLYLRQHADNPVDWYPWGPEALDESKQSGKPIFLSIGYSACHWCHVMEHESFEDAATAEVMNEHFVSIKVDREERPDLDQTLHDRPPPAIPRRRRLADIVWLTPDLRPFYAGTYFPPKDMYGRPSFKPSAAWGSQSPGNERQAGGSRLSACQAIRRSAHRHDRVDAKHVGLTTDAVLKNVR